MRSDACDFKGLADAFETGAFVEGDSPDAGVAPDDCRAKAIAGVVDHVVEELPAELHPAMVGVDGHPAKLPDIGARCVFMWGDIERADGHDLPVD